MTNPTHTHSSNKTPLSHQLGDVNVVAGKCACSTRHVYRLADAGRMPAPLRLGNLVRWDLNEIDRWIADGCPRCDKKGGRR